MQLAAYSCSFVPPLRSTFTFRLLTSTGKENSTITPELRFGAFQVPTSPARLDRYDTRNGHGDLMQKREGDCAVRKVKLLLREDTRIDG